MVGMARGGVADGTRHGQGGTCGDVAFVAEELKAGLDPRSGQWMKGRYVPSLLAAIGFMSAPDNPGAREGVLIEQDNDRPRIETRARSLPQVCALRPHPPGGLRPLHLVQAFEVRVT